MRETTFIQQNKEKWQEFEQVLEKKSKDPDKLNDLFIQITDDLSYSRTFYPNRSVRVYLNALAQRIFYNIYKTKKIGLDELVRFWTTDLPLLVYASRNAFLIAFCIFALAFLIGAWSAHQNADFVRLILGDDYVEMTIENIESGDPMAVYKQKGEFGMSLGITVNNIFVAFLTFTLGALFAIGSFFILFKNGIMVGAFQYFFYEKGVLQESLLTIWIHGTLEISAIIIAGAAGITMGSGLIFPGTYSRLHAFQASAKKGLKILIGTIPLFVLAGFFEGYLTRQTEAPELLRALFIGLCLTFVVFYFLFLPVYKGRKHKSAQPYASTLRKPENQALSFNKIKENGKVFQDVFVLLKKHFKPIGAAVVSGAAFYCILLLIVNGISVTEKIIFSDSLFASIGSMGQFFFNNDLAFLSTIVIVAFSIIAFGVLQTLSQEVFNQKNTTLKKKLFLIVKIITGTTAIYLACLGGYLSPIAMLFLFPPILLWIYIMCYEDIGFIAGIGRLFFLLKGNFGKIIGLFILLLSVGLLAYSLMDTALIWLYIEIVAWNIPLEEEQVNQLLATLLIFSNICLLGFIYTIFLLGHGLLYHVLVEIREAPSLRKAIENIGVTQQIKGLEKEANTNA